jgi:hypothetical protein
MGAPTVNYEILADGYEVTAGEGGLRAIVPCIVAWEDAFTFADDVMGYGTAVVVGPVSYSIPWRFPGAPNAKMYASGCRITPIGAKRDALADGEGLRPGQYFTYAKVVVEFSTPPFKQAPEDDPANLHQLDPDNPITYCEQSVESGGTMETRRKGGYEFAEGDLTIVRHDLAVFVPESRLVLNFPRIPFLPWQRIQTYLGTLNDRIIFQCAVGTLLFEDAKTRFSATSQGLMGQSFQMTLVYRGWHWNMIPHPATGINTLVHKKGDPTKSLYEIKDWRPLFLL